MWRGVVVECWGDSGLCLYSRRQLNFAALAVRSCPYSKISSVLCSMSLTPLSYLKCVYDCVYLLHTS